MRGGKMTPDDFVYCLILVLSVPFGHIVKISKGPENKRLLSSGLGVLIIVLTCRLHILHSLITTVVSCLIIRIFGARKCHAYNFIWCFGYLVFFRTCYFFGLPKPPALSNAVQLLLTLRMTGISFELYDTEVINTKKTMSEDDMRLKRKYQDINPSVKDIIFYAYCYIGLFTGPYYKYRTYYDMLHNENTSQIDVEMPLIERCKPLPYIAVSFFFFMYFFNIEYAHSDEFFEQPFWFRLFYMVPMFIIFRTRLYSAWILSECMCHTSTLGAYPVACKPKCGQGPTDLKALEESETMETKDYSFETVRNLDIYGCELAPTTKDGLRSWNMTVQYWLAAMVHRRVPSVLRSYRVTVTMTVSAFWHGIHSGYYLSFLLVPIILAAENGMIAAFRDNKDEQTQKLFDWACWFFKMRGFDYMCMGFLLLRLDYTLWYWSSVYFIGHVFTFIFIILGIIFKPKRQNKLSKDSNFNKVE